MGLRGVEEDETVVVVVVVVSGLSLCSSRAHRVPRALRLGLVVQRLTDVSRGGVDVQR